MILTLFLIAIVTFALGFFIIPHLVQKAHELHLYDSPDERKVHKRPIPRIGGVIFLPIAMFTFVLVFVVYYLIRIDVNELWDESSTRHFLAYICGAILIYSIGLYDDIYGASYRIKFVFQIAAALILCSSGLWIANFSNVFFIKEVHVLVGAPFTILFIVFVTNAMNLIDGIDGLASGLSIIAFTIIFFLNFAIQNYIWVFFCAAFIGVLIAFYYYNVYSWKYKIFMGDAGSLTLGYTLTFLVLHFWQRDPVWNPIFHNVGLVAISPLTIPMLDVIRVFFVRIKNKKNPFLPDKNHIHHLLLAAGFNARDTLMLILVFSVIIIVANYLIADFISQTVMLITDVVLYAGLVFMANSLRKEKEKDDMREF